MVRDRLSRLSQDLLNDPTLLNSSQPLVQPAMEKRQPVVIQTHQVQEGGMQIGDMAALLDCLEAEFIRGAVSDSSFDAASCEPTAEALGMMVSSGPLGCWRAAEFGSPDDQRILQQSAAFQVFQ